AEPSDTQSPEQQISEKAGEDVMEEEAQVAGGRHWHDEAQQPGWVKHVPVPRGDEREAAEHCGVPERQMPESLVPLGAPRMERNTRDELVAPGAREDRKSTRLKSSHLGISYAVFCLKKKKKKKKKHKDKHTRIQAGETNRNTDQ